MINPWKPARRDPDLERIEQLYREYRLPLWRYAFKLLHDEHLADDVVQSVFIKAIEKSELISSLDCNKSRAYFVIMVRNLSYTLYRQQKRHPMVGLADLEEALIRQCEQEEVHKMLDQLNQSYRDALTMKYLYGMTDAEIAGVMGIKPASVRVVVHRAMKALKKNYHLREEGKQERALPGKEQKTLPKKTNRPFRSTTI